MSEPTLICSAPALAQDAQRIALYSHYAVAVAGAAVGGLMIARSRVQEKVPHILCAVAAFGTALVSLYSQWEFNQYLYQCRETAVNSVAIRGGFAVVWAILLIVGMTLTPGFRYKRMKGFAQYLLIACAAIAGILSTIGETMIAAATTFTPTLEQLVPFKNDMSAFADAAKDAASTYPLAFGLPALVLVAAYIGIFVATQQKPVKKRSEESHQARSGAMTTVAVCVPAVAYAAGTFFALSERGVSGSVLLFNCAEVMAMFFMFCATMSLVGKPANFPRPVKPKPQVAAPEAEAAPTPLNNQQAYAQYYAQQLAQQRAAAQQQQAYAQYYAQQQAAAAAAQQQQAAASAVPAAAAAAAPTAQTAQTPEQIAAAQQAAYQQQQAQYYAQQQAYAAYQQQQQAYAAYAQQMAAQQQQQPYAQAYSQQQAGYQQAQKKTAVRIAQPGRPAARPGAAPRPAGAVKKIGGPGGIKKIR